MDIRKNNVVNTAAYAAVALGTIAGELSGSHLLVYICKPLLMVILSSWFYFKSRRVGDRFTILIQAGLFFSLVGDVALMFQHLDQFNFLIGLGAFLVAQLCYTFAFAHHLVNTPETQPWIGWTLAAGILFYGVLFGMALVPSVDEGIQVPVVVYAIAITAMGVVAALRHGRTYRRSFLLVLAGAALFIASDSILATNRFIWPLEHAKWSVMLTYAAGQYLIVAGCLAHVLDPGEIRRKAALTT